MQTLQTVSHAAILREMDAEELQQHAAKLHQKKENFWSWIEVEDEYNKCCKLYRQLTGSDLNEIITSNNSSK